MVEWTCVALPAEPRGSLTGLCLVISKDKTGFCRIIHKINIRAYQVVWDSWWWWLVVVGGGGMQ